jgi:hypothetical protein
LLIDIAEASFVPLDYGVVIAIYFKLGLMRLISAYELATALMAGSLFLNY